MHTHEIKSHLMLCLLTVKYISDCKSTMINIILSYAGFHQDLARIMGLCILPSGYNDRPESFWVAFSNS